MPGTSRKWRQRAERGAPAPSADAVSARAAKGRRGAAGRPARELPDPDAAVVRVDGLARLRLLPDVAVKRLPVYLRALGDLQAAGSEIVSSAELAQRTGLTSEQIRKDLAQLGGFGTRGVGYRIETLAASIRGVLGLDRAVPVALVGAGHLGTALARYNESRHQQPRIGAIFDADASKVGEPLGGTRIRSMDELDATVEALGIRLAIIAVPAPAAQRVALRLAGAGCDVLLNFAPVRLSLPERVRVHNVDLAMELEALAYYVRPGVPPGARPEA